MTYPPPPLNLLSCSPIERDAYDSGHHAGYQAGFDAGERYAVERMAALHRYAADVVRRAAERKPIWSPLATDLELRARADARRSAGIWAFTVDHERRRNEIHGQPAA